MLGLEDCRSDLKKGELYIPTLFGIDWYRPEVVSVLEQLNKEDLVLDWSPSKNIQELTLSQILFYIMYNYYV